MRLDEWQKYIEGEFLDDDTVDLMPPANSRREPDCKHAVVIAHDHMPPLSLTLVEPTLPEHALPPNLAKEVTLPPDPGSAAPTDPAVHLGSTERQSTNWGVATPPVKLLLESPVSYGEVPDPDITLPAFDSYLPASHRAGRQVTTPLPLPPESELPDVYPQPEPASLNHDPKAITASVDSISAVISANDTTRRVARTRARHARNVRPENVPSGLSAGELWATVPKHVQTLLSLERLEEEHEVAQFSYKRPFQEKRRELIERLLDPILSLEDTARLLNVCPTTVRRYTNKGILTYYRKEPDRQEPDRPDRADATHGDSGKETRQRRFRLSDILAFLEAQQAALAANGQGEDTGSTRMRDRRIQSAQSRQNVAAMSPAIDTTATMQPAKD